jgi:hypothetical protein
MLVIGDEINMARVRMKLPKMESSFGRFKTRLLEPNWDCKIEIEIGPCEIEIAENKISFVILRFRFDLDDFILGAVDLTLIW